MSEDPERRDEPPADTTPAAGETSPGATALGDDATQVHHTAPGEAVEEVVGAPHPTAGDPPADKGPRFEAQASTSPAQEKAGEAAQKGADAATAGAAKVADAASTAAAKAGDAAATAAEKTSGAASAAAEKVAGAAQTAADRAQGAAASVQSGDAAASAAQVPQDRPEVLVGAAFAGGLALALVLRRIAS